MGRASQLEILCLIAGDKVSEQLNKGRDGLALNL